MIKTSLCSASILAIAMVHSSANENWPQWRGPLANGVAPAAKPPVTWGESNHLGWKYAIPGSGSSTPIIWGDQVFLLTAIPLGADGKPAPPKAQPATPPPTPAPAPAAGNTNDPNRRPGPPRSEAPTQVHQFTVLSIDRTTGKERWRTVVREVLPHEGHHADHGFASHSPITDGERLYVHWGSRGLHALDLSGKILWQKDLGRMETRNDFGEGGSPALAQGILVVNWDHEGEDFIAAFEAATGKELWRQPRQEATTWTTPLIVERGNGHQVVVAATTRTRSYDLKTGQQLWESGGMTANVIPAPVSGFGLVYAISGFRGDAIQAIPLGAEGDLTGSTTAYAWTATKDAPYVPSPLLYGERLYFLSDNRPVLSSRAARDGKLLIDAERLPDIFTVYASPLGADGRVYIPSREGKTVVLKDGDQLEVLAVNSLEDRFDASPVAVGSQLFLRGKQHLYCLQEK